MDQNVEKAVSTFPKALESKWKPNERDRIGAPLWSRPAPDADEQLTELGDFDSGGMTASGRGKSPLVDTGPLCEKCVRLNLSHHKFTARTTLTATTHTSTTTILPGDFDSIGFDSAHLGHLDEIYGRSPRCTFCRLIYECTHSDTGQGIGHDGLDTEGNRVSCKLEWHLDSRSADSRPTTRRLLVSNDNGAFPDFYVVPVMEPTVASVGGTPAGRLMDKNAADLRLLSAWLESCESNHPECSDHQEANHVPLAIDIRLIDVFKMAIRSFSPNNSPKYAALSYVWGTETKPMKLSTKNFEKLHREGGLAEFRSSVPATVWDAFEVVRQLGIPYIWVDALCIIHDDAQDVMAQILVMDKIFQHAIITICVAAGHGSHSGIPGIGKTPKNVQQAREPYRDLLLTGMRPVASLIQDSIWDSRAWTFQERLLSARCAIFTSAGIVWQCPTITWREDMASPLDHKLWSLDSVGSPLRTLMGNPLRSYSTCVKIYSSRKLTLLGDKLIAFSGLEMVLGHKLDSEFIFGLPSRYFDWALLWEPESSGKRIRLAAQRDPWEDFPSWSWCGWNHQVDWRLSTVGGPLFNLHEWLTERTWIIWRVGRNNNWELVHCSRVPPKDAPTYQAMRWDGYACGTATQYGRSATAARCRHVPKVHEAELDCLLETTSETPRDGYLLFKTFTGFFTLSRKSMSKSAFQSTLAPDLFRFGITDSSGDWCGSIILDKTWMNSVGAIFEFAAISDAKEFTLEELDTWTYYIPEERQQAEWYCFNAIMLQWQVGADGTPLPVAERVGLAKIFQSSFFGRSFKPCEWKRIVLA